MKHVLEREKLMRLHTRETWRTGLARRWALRLPVVAFVGLMTAVTSAAAQGCQVSLKPVPLAGLSEASGVAVGSRSSGTLWSHNDSGEPVLFAISSTGEVRGRTRVTGARVTDWEAMSAGPCPNGTCLYVGDIGDNSGKRRDITIYRVPEPDAGAGSTANAEAMRATYPEGPQDAEGLFVMPGGALFIVTKGEHGPVAVYRAPSFRGGATVQLERVASITPAREKGRGGVAEASKVTDASASPDGRWIALRTKGAVRVFAASELTVGTVREVLTYDLEGLGETQGEGVAVGNDGSVWLTSEGGGKGRPGSLARLTCSMP